MSPSPGNTSSGLLPTLAVEKPWGMDHLPAPFTAPPGQRIGEIWFEPPAGLDQLLVKYIFTSEKLSVQVHPSDEQTEAAGLGRQGKEECWLVLATEPGASLGVGFHRHHDAATLRAAALDGSIEDLLAWHPVAPGDFFYIPANTVHAIGAGVTLVEIQQNSDITYRLFDYGRPRELHLEQGMAVARGEPYDRALRRKLVGGEPARLVEGPHFRLDRLAGAPDAATTARYAGAPLLVIPLVGMVQVKDEAGQLASVAPGTCALAPDVTAIQFAPDGLCLIAQPCAVVGA